MMIIKAYLFIAITSIFHLPSVVRGGHLKAFIYYEDASCVDSNTISGTFIYAYSDTSMSDEKGFSKKHYNSTCKYFKGGFYDFEYNSGNKEKMYSGYCIKCNGTVGCTSKEGRCKYFQTAYPSEEPYYSGKYQRSSRKYGTALSFTNNSSSVAFTTNELEAYVYQSISPATSSISFPSSFFFGMVALLGIMLTILTHRRLEETFFRKEVTSVDSSEFLDRCSESSSV